MRIKGTRPPGPTITLAADAVQGTVALVTETATATAGSTITWTLQELAPGGTWTDATASLSATSGTSVTWTPDALGYQYAVTAVATLNGQTATARRAVRCGQGQATLTWTQVNLWDFSAAANVAAPALDGDPITVAGLTMGTDNAQGGAGVGSWSNVNGQGLTSTLPATTALNVATTGATNRASPVLTMSQAQLGVALDAASDVVVLFKIAAFAPTNNGACFQVGVESTGTAMGGGTTGRGESFGPGRTGGASTVFEHYQDTGGSVGQVTATGSPASTPSTWRVLAIRVSGTSTVSFYYSDNAAHFDAADPLSVMSYGDSGPGRFRLSAPAAISFLAWVGTLSVASPDAAVIQALRVLRRAATLT